MPSPLGNGVGVVPDVTSTQGQHAETRCANDWVQTLTSASSAAQCAAAFVAWACKQPDLAGTAVTAVDLRRYYEAAKQFGWPAYVKFAEEVAALVPRRRLWVREPGWETMTVYHIPPLSSAAVVPIRKTA
jgi:hypothetical protein